MATDVGGISLEELKAKRDDIMRIAAAHDAHNVRVFGSVARGEADPESDVDFLVDFNTSAHGLEYFGLLDDLRTALEGLLGMSVDVVELRGTYSERGAQMAAEIWREAVPL